MPPKKKPVKTATKSKSKKKDTEVINNVCDKCGIMLPTGHIVQGDFRYCSPGCSN